KDLPDAMLVLDELLTEEQKTQIRNYSELEAGAKLHFNLGQWIRNQWLYNPESPLREIFKGFYFIHEDDKSSLITELYYRHLQGEAMNWEEEMANLDPYERIKRRREQGS